MGLFHVTWNSFRKAAHLGIGEEICHAPLDKRQEKVVCGILSLSEKNVSIFFYWGERVDKKASILDLTWRQLLVL